MNQRLFTFLSLPVVTKDALAAKHGEYDIVLANPPFGKKSSVTIVNEAGETSKESLIVQPPRFAATAALRISLPLFLNALSRKQSA